MECSDLTAENPADTTDACGGDDRRAAELQWVCYPAQEWPTWSLLCLCYAGWLLLIVLAGRFSYLWLLPVIPLVTLHSSLQHEALHGHPSRRETLNEALVFPALGLLIPYRRFRSLHRQHHDDERLTDPYDDPESWYISTGQWQHCSAMKRWVLSANGSLLGRLLLGPALSIVGFYRSDWQHLRIGERSVRIAWALHVTSVAGVLLIASLAGVPPLLYLTVVAYPAMSVLMIRTFIEHRAAGHVAERTAVVEAGRLMSLLFLNNNLHAVHHRYPGAPWYRLPALWRADRDNVLQRNGAYHYPGGYLSVARRWLLRRREPVLHPMGDHSRGRISRE